MADKTVLITGATGQQGGAVARELLKTKKLKVRAMTRKPDSPAARELASLGAEIVKADLDDAASLEKALKGAWGVFAVQNTWEAGVEKEEEQGKRLAELAKKAGVQHYVYTSVGSAHRNTGIPHFDNKWRVEQKVRELEFPSRTILRPVFFMENWLGPWLKPALDQGKVMIGLEPKTKLQQIAVEDIGRFGALSFEQPEKLAGHEIDLAGDSKTGPETAETVGRALGRKLEFARVPIAEVRKMSEDYALMLEWFDRVGYDVDIPALSTKYGIRPRTLEQWAAEKLKTPAGARP